MSAKAPAVSPMAAEKVIAHITEEDRLLVFSHSQHPEAGIQVPGGTVEAGESPAVAVLREAREETGLDGLQIQTCLGVQEYALSAPGGAAIQRRHVFHLTLRGAAPARWRHYEHHPSDGSPGPIELEFFWVRFPDRVPELAGGQGELLHALERAIEQVAW
ncbi:MAG: NUDIX domain-containing protein [Chloroflexi bacterium]|nr:NUDIX domain-containing protein [Chloroflexota bacterium]